MLVYSNHLGMPHDVNIYYNPENCKWVLTTVWSMKPFSSAESLMSYMKEERMLDSDICKAIEKAERKIKALAE